MIRLRPRFDLAQTAFKLGDAAFDLHKTCVHLLLAGQSLLVVFHQLIAGFRQLGICLGPGVGQGQAALGQGGPGFVQGLLGRVDLLQSVLQKGPVVGDLLFTVEDLLLGLVQLVNGHPQYRLHLGEGLPLGTVGQHGQADQSGEGRHQMVGLALLLQRHGGIGQRQGEIRHGGLEFVGDFSDLGSLAGIARRQLGGLDVEGAGGHLRGDGGQHEHRQRESQ